MQRVFTLNLFGDQSDLSYLLDKNNFFLTYHIGLNRLISYSSEFSKEINNFSPASGISNLLNQLDSEDYFKLILSIENRKNTQIILRINDIDYNCNLVFNDLILSLFFVKLSNIHTTKILTEVLNSIAKINNNLDRHTNANLLNISGLINLILAKNEDSKSYSLDVFITNLCHLTNLDLVNLKDFSNYLIKITDSTFSKLVYEINNSDNITFNLTKDCFEIKFINNQSVFRTDKFNVELKKSEKIGNIFIFDSNFEKNSLEIFDSFNYSVSLFKNEDEFFQKLLKEDPDAILIDPPVFRANQILRKIKNLTNSPIIGIMNKSLEGINNNYFDKIYAKPLNFKLIKKILTSDLIIPTSNKYIREIA